jgi:hypothetical protein
MWSILLSSTTNPMRGESGERFQHLLINVLLDETAGNVRALCTGATGSGTLLRFMSELMARGDRGKSVMGTGAQPPAAPESCG